MFADYLHPEILSGPNYQRSAIFSGTRQYATHVLLTKIGLSQAKRRTPSPTQRLVRFRGIPKIVDPGHSSIGILKILSNFSATLSPCRYRPAPRAQLPPAFASSQAGVSGTQIKPFEAAS